jgi:FkbM family methyltransferase
MANSVTSEKGGGDDNRYDFQRWGLFDNAVRQVRHRDPTGFAVEIGANDGQTYDHLYPHIVNGLRALLVEPHPVYFERLTQLHAKRRGLGQVALARVAVGEKPEERTLFYVEEHPNLPSRVVGMAGFDRTSLERQEGVIPGITDHILDVTVPVVAYPDLLARHCPPDQTPSIVVIDTEGTDLEVARSVLEVHRPDVLVYEHEHVDPAAQAESVDTLRRLGYLVAWTGNDTLAYMRGGDDDWLADRFAIASLPR